MRKYIFIFLALAILVFPATAGGMAFIGNGDSMELQYQHAQFGEIFYEDGYENLFLWCAYDWKAPGNQSLWVFPVPGDPEEVTIIDLANGYIIYRAAEDGIIPAERIGIASGSAATYALLPLTIPFIAPLFYQGFSSYRQDAEEGIQVYKPINREGILTDRVGARDPAALEQYLSRRNISLPKESMALVHEYDGKPYTYVITSVTNVSAYRTLSAPPYYKENWEGDYIGILVRFPANRIYYPLKLTRAYGSQRIVINVDANGNPPEQFAEGISSGNGSDENYIVASRYAKPAFFPRKEYLPLFNNHTEFRPFTYSRLTISTRADNLEDDLWADPDSPETSPVERAIRDPLLIIVGMSFLYIILSMLSSLAAGVLVFGMQAAGKRTLLSHGLWNCTTLIGFSYATWRNTALPVTVAGRKGWYIIAFYAIFLISLCIVTVLLAPGKNMVFQTPLVISITAAFLLIAVPGYMAVNLLKQ